MTSRGMWVLAMALILCACGGGPAAPSPADTGDGITIFGDPRFRGEPRSCSQTSKTSTISSAGVSRARAAAGVRLRRLHFVYPDIGRTKGDGV